MPESPLVAKTDIAAAIEKHRLKRKMPAEISNFDIYGKDVWKPPFRPLVSANIKVAARRYRHPMIEPATTRHT